MKDGKASSEAGARISSDETLRLALTVSQLAYWDQDHVRQEIHRSPGWTAMLGYEPEEVGVSRDAWLELIHSEDRAAVHRAVQEHESGIEPTFRVEHRMRTKDGRWKWILNWGRIVERDDEGQPVRSLGFHLDITDRKHAELALLRSEKLATIGTLAGGLAHDFNNLLTVIRGNLQLAREAEGDTERDRRLATAERATQRAQELTDRLLTFARGGAPTLEPIDLERVVTDARDLVLSGSNCRLQLEAEAALPPVAGSSGHLGQVFQNLLLNAAQAMPDGGVITARVRRFRWTSAMPEVLEPGEYVEAVVSDQGPGISESAADHIFDPFFTTRSEGKGLGLATAFSIVADHHGLLEVIDRDALGDERTRESAESSGASLRLLLPVAGEEILRNPAQSETDPSSARTARILVVDDDELVREFASSVIESLGCDVVEAEDGALAIEFYTRARAAGRPFDCVLMDLTIPGGMGGKEAVARILETDPAARVIVSSGYSDDPVMAKFRDYGFCACLAKPYAVDDVRRVIGEVLRREEGTAQA